MSSVLTLVSSSQQIHHVVPAWITKYPKIVPLIQFSTIHSAFLAQGACLLIGIITLCICLVAHTHSDAPWNAELRKHHSSMYKFFSYSLYMATKRIMKEEFIFRERQEYAISMIIQGYILMAFLLHMSLYWICKEANYRISFGKILNIGLIILTTASLLLILHATIEINTDYDELKEISFFRTCRIGSNEQDSVFSTVAVKNVSNPKLFTLSERQKMLMCNRSDLRFAAIALLCFNVCVMFGIVFFAKFNTVNLDKSEDTRDLLYDGDEGQRIHLVWQKQNLDEN